DSPRPTSRSNRPKSAASCSRSTPGSRADPSATSYRCSSNATPRTSCLGSAPQILLSGKPSSKGLQHSIDRTQLPVGGVNRATDMADRSHLANCHRSCQSACLRSKPRLQFGFLLLEEPAEVLGLGLVSPARRVMVTQRSTQGRPIAGRSEDSAHYPRSALPCG